MPWKEYGQQISQLALCNVNSVTNHNPILSLNHTCLPVDIIRRRKTLISNRDRWSPLSLFRQVHLGIGKSENNLPSQGYELLQPGKQQASAAVIDRLMFWQSCHRGQADDPPFVGTTAGTQPKCGNGGVSDAVTSELGDRQSSHPVKNPASVSWQVFRGVARCCLPRFQGQPQHLKYQNRFIIVQQIKLDIGHFSLLLQHTVRWCFHIIPSMQTHLTATGDQ